MRTAKETALITLFEQWAGEQATTIEQLPPSGSYREYYRIRGCNKSAIGVYNEDVKENHAFFSFTRHFCSKGLPVPELLGQDDNNKVYLISDLGYETLYNRVNELKQDDGFPEPLMEIYKKAMEHLACFQVLGGQGLDYSCCYPRAAFDKQSMLWDLNYFKYYFLKLAKAPFNEHELEKDFHTFTDFLLQADCDFFLYRDFQTRNIMLLDGKLYFIDYQGGRKGALQYDVASILFQAKIAIPHEIRQQLIDHYLDAIKLIYTISNERFMEHFYGYVLIRMLQAMGAYGFRGFYEKKEHFLSSIPFVLENIRWLLKNVSIPVHLPALTNILEKIDNAEELKKYLSKKDTPNVLQVTINSFSYPKGIPTDISGHGGGFVFDCRAIPNPGKYEEYQALTGKDQKVINYLAKSHEAYNFLTNVFGLVDQSIEKYIERNFTSLTVSFGCTGGRHRSVYFAEKLARHIQDKYSVKIVINHIELNK